MRPNPLRLGEDILEAGKKAELRPGAEGAWSRIEGRGRSRGAWSEKGAWPESSGLRPELCLAVVQRPLSPVAGSGHALSLQPKRLARQARAGRGGAGEFHVLGRSGGHGEKDS